MRVSSPGQGSNGSWKRRVLCTALMIGTVRDAHDRYTAPMFVCSAIRSSISRPPPELAEMDEIKVLPTLGGRRHQISELGKRAPNPCHIGYLDNLIPPP
ncbi:unnamed protein product [Nezara viridula]|uniref:Uncharacterized protein n=1 Tax=Nezara viridula TaxID=85310 RepID=A0A9P0MPS3_NEZVI|nr:unnamed protein product [Nezara viridula]